MDRKETLARLGAGLAIACTAFALRTSSPPPCAAPAAAIDPLADELQRVLLEQDLMLAERTAILLEELEERLASWQPASDGGRGA